MSGIRGYRAGFTVMEMAIVGAMMGFLAVFLSMAWSGLGQPSVDTMVRCELQREAQLAAMSLAADCGGYVPETTLNRTLMPDALGGASNPVADELWLGDANGEEPYVRYYRDATNNTLFREARYHLSSTLVTESRAVASNVCDMQVDEESEPGDIRSGYIKVNLTFQFRETGCDAYRTCHRYLFYVPM